ncbi:hypothetical protein [Dactylosporangium sp. NPDC000521]|uniref:hypothetical protein n=1 Tax=Dactylosporangium sp. NPDC000521 TaxID=3363975 RepID=UPI0036975CF8
MKRQPWGLYAIAAAIGIVGAVAFGVPAHVLLFAVLALACPMMMLLMMGGMHDGRGGQGQTGEHGGSAVEDHDQTPTASRQ